MIMSQKSPSRLAAGAKLFVVLLAAAAVPAWTLGQSPPAEKPQEGTIDQLIELKAVLDVDGKSDVFFWAEADPNADTKTKALEAKIAALKQQLEALKAVKAAAEKLKDTQPLRFKVVTDAEPAKQGASILILDGASGKIIERHDVKTPPNARIEVVKPKEGESNVRVIIVDGTTGKIVETRETKTLQPPKGEVPQGQYQGIIKAADPNKPMRVVVVGEDGKFIKEVVGAAPNKYWVESARLPQVRVIGPDGKEIPGAKVFIDGKPYPAVPGTQAKPNQPPASGQPYQIELKFDANEKWEEAVKKLTTARARLATEPQASRQPGAMSGAAVTRTHMTYKLPQDKAATLAAFLKENVKAPGLELKVADDGLGVTATPELQHAIGTLVNLMGQVRHYPTELQNYYRSIQVPK
jgi:hypothetical protein